MQRANTKWLGLPLLPSEIISAYQIQGRVDYMHQPVGRRWISSRSNRTRVRLLQHQTAKQYLVIAPQAAFVIRPTAQGIPYLRNRSRSEELLARVPRAKTQTLHHAI